jgi:hypothetical protein
MVDYYDSDTENDIESDIQDDADEISGMVRSER